jgi:hypothetical protein
MSKSHESDSSTRFAMTTAAKTAAQINARCVGGSILSGPLHLRLAKSDQF